MDFRKFQPGTLPSVMDDRHGRLNPAHLHLAITSASALLNLSAIVTAQPWTPMLLARATQSNVGRSS
jgi:hypothetical protein